MRRTLVVALVLAALPGAARAAAPQPVVQGARMVDARTGATWVARGVNWPSFEYACQQGWGYSSDGANAATAIAAWHATAVRIPLNQDCWLGDDGQPAFGDVAGYRAAVQSFVTALEGAGLVPILDLHRSGPNGVVADGQRALGDDRSPAFWASVAGAYHDDASVLFDAFNEPYSRYDGDTLTFDLTWSCWRDGGVACGAGAPKQNDMQAPFDGTRYTPAGMAALVAAIRGAGAPQPILVGGVDYSNDLR
jgi:Cellulase (glycosyl hydrolase family 5)